jgi:uncharacterized membrane protein (UPF0182 family)
MLTAAAAVATPAPAMATGTFNLGHITIDIFDLFVIAFTVLIAIGVFRSMRAKDKNKVAIGFGGISLIVFLLMDVVMVQHWFSA